jgi:glutamate/tyrosine decarboxylase-like PLP-dependent enzyme
MSERQLSFEEVRDRFFINPKNPDPEVVKSGIGHLVDSWLDGKTKNLLKDDLDELDAISLEIVSDYLGSGPYDGTAKGGARRFDELSVAQVHPVDNIIGLFSHVASTLANNNTIISEDSPLESEYETKAVKWMLEHIAGYDPEVASGALVSGGTSANITALLVAREALQDSEFTADPWDGKSPIKILASVMTHYSIDKTSRILGPRGLIQVDSVPLIPGSYTMDPNALREMVIRSRSVGEKIMAIVAVAGETETGLVDDLDSIAEIAQDNGIFLHFDGAYGAPFVLSRQGHLLSALSESDSLACDPQKYLYAQYSVGSVMFADSAHHELLGPLNDGGKHYMFKDDEARAKAQADLINISNPNINNLGHRRIEGSMGGQAASTLYNTIKYIGKNGLKQLLDHTLDVTTAFSDEIGRQNSGLQLSYEPVLNQVCIEPSLKAANNDERVELVSRSLYDDLGIYLSTTSLPVVDGQDKDARAEYRKVFRFVATHPHTSEEDARYIAEELSKLWTKI